VSVLELAGEKGPTLREGILSSQAGMAKMLVGKTWRQKGTKTILYPPARKKKGFQKEKNPDHSPSNITGIYSEGKKRPSRASHNERGEKPWRQRRLAANEGRTLKKKSSPKKRAEREASKARSRRGDNGRDIC